MFKVVALIRGRWVVKAHGVDWMRAQMDCRLLEDRGIAVRIELV